MNSSISSLHRLAKRFGSTRRSAAYIQLICPSIKQHAYALGLLLISILMFILPHGINPLSELSGAESADGLLYFWLMKSAAPSVFGLNWFDTTAFFPHPGSLAWNDNFILPSLIAWPFLKAGIGEILIFNLMTLASLLLCGWYTFRLSFGLTGSFLAAISGALAVQTSPFLGSALIHPQYLFFFWLPVLAFYVFRFLESQHIKYALIPGLLIIPAFFCSIVYALTGLLLIASLLLALYVLRSGLFSRFDLLKIASGFLISLLLLLPFLLPYAGAFEFKAAVATHAWPGIFTGLLALLAFKKLCEVKPSKPWLYSAIATFLVSLLSRGLLPDQWVLTVLALGVSLSLMVKALKNLAALESKAGCEKLTSRAICGVFFLCAIVFQLLSILVASGLQGAFEISSVFCLIIISSIALAQLLAKIGVDGRYAGLVVLIPLLILLENHRLPPVPIRPMVAPEALKSIPGPLSPDDALLTLPLTENALQNARVMNWAADAGILTTAGYSAMFNITSPWPGFGVKFGSAAELTALLSSLSNLRYVLLTASADESLRSMLNSISSQLSLIGTDPEGNRLFEFTPQTRLTSDFRLKLRPACGRMLRIELMSPPRSCVPGKGNCGKGKPAEKLKLLLNGSALGEAELSHEGTWGVYSFELPCVRQLEDSAVSFSLPENVSVFLRQRRVE